MKIIFEGESGKEGLISLGRRLPCTSRLFSLQRFCSYKNQASHYCESALEADALLMLEFEPKVVSYTTQPFSILYRSQGRLRRYTPDVLVRFSNGTFGSIEVKPLAKLKLVKNINKFEQLKKIFEHELGHRLQLLSSKAIHQGVQIENLKLLYPYLQQRVLISERAVFELLPQQLTFDALKTMFLGFSYSAPLRLIAHGYFEWNKLAPLTGNSLLRKVGAADDWC